MTEWCVARGRERQFETRSVLRVISARDACVEECSKENPDATNALLLSLVPRSRCNRHEHVCGRR